MKLQCDFAVEGVLLGIGEIHSLHAVQTRFVAIANYFHEIVIPLALANLPFVFRRGPNCPASSVFPIDASDASLCNRSRIACLALYQPNLA